MIDNIKKYLESKSLKFWTIRELEESRDELYTIGYDIESIRKVQDKFYICNVYVDHDSYTGSGLAKIPFNASLSFAKKAIDNAVENAKEIKNEFYKIEQKRYEYKEIDNSIPSEELLKIKESFTIPSNIDLSSSEYFIDNVRERFINSAGNSYTFTKGAITLDKVFLSKDGEYESQFMIKFANNNVDLQELMEQQAKYTIDAKDAVLPSTGKYKVVFTGEVLEEFFSFFTFHSLGSSFYNKYSLFKKDDRVTNMNLTFSSDPFLSGLESRPADSLGFPMEKFSFIEEGILTNIVANNRYSQYLKQKYTGELGNVVIKEGKYKYDDLISEENTIVIARVSCFSPKELTGDFSSEIRLAYINKNGRQIALKGGSFSGNIRNFNRIFLSKERVQFNSYIGPKAIALEGVDITG